MAIPKNKEELLSAIHENYSKLKKDLESVPVKLASKVELEGHAKGTKMSVANLVSYLIGWGELVLKWHRKKNNCEEVDFPETGFKWNELGRLAQKFYTDYEQFEYNSLLAKLDKVVNEIILLINSYDNHQLYDTTWYDKWTMGRMIQLNTSSPYKNAMGRVRRWKKERKLKL